MSNMLARQIFSHSSLDRDGVAVAFVVLTSLLIAALLWVAIVLAVKRDTPVVMYANPIALSIGK